MFCSREVQLGDRKPAGLRGGCAKLSVSFLQRGCKLWCRGHFLLTTECWSVFRKWRKSETFCFAARMNVHRKQGVCSYFQLLFLPDMFVTCRAMNPACCVNLKKVRFVTQFFVLIVSNLCPSDTHQRKQMQCLVALVFLPAAFCRATDLVCCSVCVWTVGLRRGGSNKPFLQFVYKVSVSTCQVPLIYPNQSLVV